MKTLKVSFAIGCHVKRDGFACRNEGQSGKPLGSRMVMYTRLASHKWVISHKGTMLQSATTTPCPRFVPYTYASVSNRCPIGNPEDNPTSMGAWKHIRVYQNLEVQ